MGDATSTPAADTTRRPLVRRRESWISAAWRAHGGDLTEFAVFMAAIVGIAGAYMGAAAGVGWLLGIPGVIVGMSPVLLALGGGLVWALFDSVRRIDSSRRYLDDNGGES